MKKILIKSILIGNALILIFSFSCDDHIIVEPPAGFVHGYIYEAGTNDPVDSANIYIPSSTISVFADNNGYYILNAFPGNTILFVSKEGYLIDSAEIRILPIDTISQNFELQKE